MSDYGYPYLTEQLATQQIYPQPQGALPVEQAMPAPAVAPSAYLSKLADLLHAHSQEQASAQQPKSSNMYSQNNAQNPYSIEGGSALDAIHGRRDSTKTEKPKA